MDWLRMLANENGLPFAAVQRLAEELGEREDFGALLRLCEERGSALQIAAHGFASKTRALEQIGEQGNVNPQTTDAFHHVNRILLDAPRGFEPR